jgi:hypothetical protein
VPTPEPPPGDDPIRAAFRAAFDARPEAVDLDVRADLGAVVGRARARRRRRRGLVVVATATAVALLASGLALAADGGGARGADEVVAADGPPASGAESLPPCGAPPVALVGEASVDASLGIEVSPVDDPERSDVLLDVLAAGRGWVDHSLGLERWVDGAWVHEWDVSVDPWWDPGSSESHPRGVDLVPGRDRAHGVVHDHYRVAPGWYRAVAVVDLSFDGTTGTVRSAPFAVGCDPDGVEGELTTCPEPGTLEDLPRVDSVLGDTDLVCGRADAGSGEACSDVVATSTTSPGVITDCVDPEGRDGDPTCAELLATTTTAASTSGRLEHVSCVGLETATTSSTTTATSTSTTPETTTTAPGGSAEPPAPDCPAVDLVTRTVRGLLDGPDDDLPVIEVTWAVDRPEAQVVLTVSVDGVPLGASGFDPAEPSDLPGIVTLFWPAYPDLVVGVLADDHVLLAPGTTTYDGQTWWQPSVVTDRIDELGGRLFAATPARSDTIAATPSPGHRYQICIDPATGERRR